MGKRISDAELNERYKSVPHFDAIVKDGTVEIPSIFMFESGETEYYPFLQACRKMNCTVHLANEDITIAPGEDDMMRRIKEMLYFQMARSPEMVKQYLDYVLERKRMSWDSVQRQHNPISMEEEHI